MPLERRTPLGPGAPLRRTAIARGSKPLRARSARRAALAPERAAFVAETLAQRDSCEFYGVVRDSGASIGWDVERRRPLLVRRGLPNELLPCCLWRVDTLPARSTDVHEIVPRGRGGHFVPSQGEFDVAALCRVHHDWIHHDRPALAAELGFLSPNQETIR